MRNQALTRGAAAFALAVSVTAGQASLNFAGINNIQFNTSPSDSFQLNPIVGSSGSPQFSFTGVDAGLVGWISGGAFTVNMGSLTTVTVGGQTIQSANVTGSGNLDVYDGSKDLTAAVNFMQIHTITPLGQGGVADALSINLTSIAYTGTNADLLALQTAGSGNINFTFQFSGTDPTLTQLFTGPGGTQASYSGSLSAASVPEPSTVIASLLLLLPFAGSAVRILHDKLCTKSAGNCRENYLSR